MVSTDQTDICRTLFAEFMEKPREFDIAPLIGKISESEVPFIKNGCVGLIGIDYFIKTIELSENHTYYKKGCYGIAISYAI